MVASKLQTVYKSDWDLEEVGEIIGGEFGSAEVAYWVKKTQETQHHWVLPLQAGSDLDILVWDWTRHGGIFGDKARFVSKNT